jgi:molecular chaperone DnaJ
LQKAKLFHPDVNKDPKAKEQFAEVQQAYETLKDKNKRQMYDTTGQVDDQGPNVNYEDIFDQFFGKNRQGGGFPGGGFGQGGGFPGGGFPGGGFPGGGSEFQGDFEGFGGHKTERKRGVDVHINDEISLKDAIYGTTKDVHYLVQKRCGTCTGTGKNKSIESKCPVCQGSGVSQNGFFKTKCQSCSGSGKISPSCSSCSGKGTISSKTDLTVTTPRFMQNEHKLKGRGRGHAGVNGGEDGDLVLTLNILPDAMFRRNNNIIESTININMFQAILGSTTKVTGLDRKEQKTITIPPYSQNGHFQKEFFGGVEHHFFFNIIMPHNLSKDHIRLIQQIGYQIGEKF